MVVLLLVLLLLLLLSGVSHDMEVDDDDDDERERLYTGGNMAESTGESGDRRHESNMLGRVVGGWGVGGGGGDQYDCYESKTWRGGK